MGNNKRKNRSRKGNNNGRKSVGAGPKLTAVNVSIGDRVPRNNLLSTRVNMVAPSMRTTAVFAVSNLTSVAASTFTELFNVQLNNAYQPSVGLTASSAGGFLRMMGFYSKCYVIGANLRIHYTNNTSAAGTGIEVPVCIGLTTTTFPTAMTSLPTAIEHGFTDFRTVGVSPDSVILSSKVDIAKFVNIPDILSNPSWYCTATGGPAQGVWAHFWMQNFYSSAAVVPLQVIELVMDVVFLDPIPEV